MTSLPWNSRVSAVLSSPHPRPQTSAGGRPAPDKYLMKEWMTGGHLRSSNLKIFHFLNSLLTFRSADRVPLLRVPLSIPSNPFPGPATTPPTSFSRPSAGTLAILHPELEPSSNWSFKSTPYARHVVVRKLLHSPFCTVSPFSKINVKTKRSYLRIP